MAVDNEEAAAVGCGVDRLLLNCDVAVIPVETGDELIVVSRDVDYAGALAGRAQNFLDDVVVLLWPVGPAAELPDINQITDDIERLDLVVAQEVEKGSGVAGARAEMQIGYPRGAHTPGGRRFDDAHIFKARRFSERVYQRRRGSITNALDRYLISPTPTNPTRSTIFCPDSLRVKSTNSFAGPVGSPFV